MPARLIRYFLCLLLAKSLLPAALAEEHGTTSSPPGYVFEVIVKSAKELNVILDRADSLRKLFKPDQYSRIAIVLHGEELQLFQKNNYSANQSIVERARLLDQDQVIDIMACQTMMRDLDIQQSELPAFIEQIPLAPVEIDRLIKEEGFTQL